MDPNAVIAVVNTILPEVLSFIRSFHKATGNLPTDDEVIAQMNLDADRVTAISDKWLNEHSNA